jgi:hypothetical protein
MIESSRYIIFMLRKNDISHQVTEDSQLDCQLSYYIFYISDLHFL